MLTRTPKPLVLGHGDMSTFRADIDAIAMGAHRHEVVELNTIRAADDHRLSPQAGFPLFCAQCYTHNCYADVKTSTQKYIAIVFLAICHFRLPQDLRRTRSVRFQRSDSHIREMLVFHQDEDALAGTIESLLGQVVLWVQGQTRLTKLLVARVTSGRM